MADSQVSLYIHNVKQVFLIYLPVQNQNLQASKLLKILPYSLVITSSAFLFFRGYLGSYGNYGINA